VSKTCVLITVLVLSASLHVAAAGYRVEELPPVVRAVPTFVWDGDWFEAVVQEVDASIASRVPTLEPGSPLSVRLIGINAPQAYDLWECFSSQAVQEMRTLLCGREVFLELDTQMWDSSGRLLAYVYVRSPISPTQFTMVNDMLVLKGFAEVMTVPPNSRYSEAFLGSQATARRIGLGIWGECTVCWDQAHQHLGNRMVVEGPIVDVRSQGGTLFLDVGRRHPDPRRLVIAIGPTCVERFDESGEQDFRTRFVGSVARVYGSIQCDQGVPEITLCDPMDIWVVSDEANAG
jgi:endonuclease YncB( thermonuclease family)